MGATSWKAEENRKTQGGNGKLNVPKQRGGMRNDP